MRLKQSTLSDSPAVPEAMRYPAWRYTLAAETEVLQL
jgi:hypothetical protein